MAIDVRIPTILRSYTGGAKAVASAGDTPKSLLWESCRERARKRVASRS